MTVLVHTGAPALGILAAALAAACQPAPRTPPPTLGARAMVAVANTEPLAVAALPCAEGMVLVPDGSFLMGAPEGEGDADEHPAHEAAISAFCLDRTEVTVAAYRDCARSTGPGRCEAVPKGEDFVYFDEQQLAYFDRFCNADRLDRDRHPINCVSWAEADAYCHFVGGRLPTEAEWEYAARGPDNRKYPWGAELPGPRLLNACGAECETPQAAFGLADAKAMYEGDDGFEGTAPVGSFPLGASPFGALDMLGNVWEWTADWVAPYPEGKVVNPHGPEAPEKPEKVIRGISSWGGEHPEYGAAARGSHAPGVRLSVGGFRCARDLR